MCYNTRRKQEEGGSVSYDLDPVDRQIVSILQQDGRTANVEIARRVGVSEATVRKRLDRLISAGVVHITAMPDAAKVGLPTVTFITLDVDLSQLDRIANHLGSSPEVRSIYYTTGESDLVVEAWFRSSDELLRFLTQHVASIPGIKRTATSHVLRTIRDGSNWVLPSESAPCILVVDDDPDFVEVTRLTLAAEGYEIKSASSGEEALALMRISKPDLVILDVMMQGILDGLQTGKEMRADDDLRTIPILMVSSITSSAFAGLFPRQESLPADNFLVKPVESSLLVAEAKRLLRTGTI
jgi:Lrp/AsnC family transcriptional regulator for asnA, asnC and gidA